MFNQVKARFGADYPMSVLFDAPTISQLAAMILRDHGDDLAVDDRGAGGSTDQPGSRAVELPGYRHLVHMAGPQQSDRLPFFLVAGMFGNVLNLRHLAMLMGRDRPFYGIQARGLRENEDPLDTFEAMAKLYIDELRQAEPVGPYLLGGFSGGGITAWEMARQLSEAGEDVAMLVMLDTPVAQRGELTVEDKLLLHAQRLRQHGLGHLGSMVKERIAWERARRGKLPRPLDPHERRSAAIEAAFYRALAVYETRPWTGDVHLYRPELTTTYRLTRGRYVNADREFQYEDNGWGAFVHGTLHVNVVPGDHDSMVLEPNVRVLASRVLADLEAVEAGLT
jgi:thioesterase domain-containing protein